MGLEVIAAAALVVSATATYEGYKGRQDQKEAYAQSAEEQRKAQGEQRALNYQQQAEEQRNQVRQERVQRAKLMQTAANTGVGDSSGAFGAIDSLSTQLNNNLGINAGRSAAGDRISGYLQNAADFNTSAQQSALSAQNADSVFGLGMSIFNSAGGFGTLTGTGKPPHK